MNNIVLLLLKDICSLVRMPSDIIVWSDKSKDWGVFHLASSLWLSVCLFVCLFVYLYVCLCLSLSVCLSVCMYVCLARSLARSLTNSLTRSIPRVLAQSLAQSLAHSLAHSPLMPSFYYKLSYIPTITYSWNNNNNGRKGNYFTWLSSLKWRRCTWSVIYCFTTGTNSK